MHPVPAPSNTSLGVKCLVWSNKCPEVGKTEETLRKVVKSRRHKALKMMACVFPTSKGKGGPMRDFNNGMVIGCFWRGKWRKVLSKARKVSCNGKEEKALTSIPNRLCTVLRPET